VFVNISDNIMSKKTSIALFTNRIGNYSNPLSNPKIFTNVPINMNKISSAQNQTLIEIKLYTKNLANINYKDIPSDIGIYSQISNILKQMLQINPTNVTYRVLLEICMTALTGSLNMYTVYERIKLDEATIVRLTLYIDEILSDKNIKSTINTVKGNYAIKKTIQLSSIYSDYINFYGFPAFGEGFDVDKLNFLKTYNL
jgi:hypothetical protein